jgi:hypothetical protein
MNSHISVQVQHIARARATTAQRDVASCWFVQPRPLEVPGDRRERRFATATWELQFGTRAATRWMRSRGRPRQPISRGRWGCGVPGVGCSLVEPLEDLRLPSILCWEARVVEFPGRGKRSTSAGDCSGAWSSGGRKPVSRSCSPEVRRHDLWCVSACPYWTPCEARHEGRPQRRKGGNIWTGPERRIVADVSSMVLDSEYPRRRLHQICHRLRLVGPCGAAGPFPGQGGAPCSARSPRHTPER